MLLIVNYLTEKITLSAVKLFENYLIFPLPKSKFCVLIFSLLNKTAVSILVLLTASSNKAQSCIDQYSSFDVGGFNQLSIDVFSLEFQSGTLAKRRPVTLYFALSR